VALLVELPVVRQVALRHDAEQPPAPDRHGAVIEPVAPAQGRADDEQRREPGALLDQPRHARLDRVEQGGLQQQILDGVGGHAEFGEDRERRPGPVCLPREAQDVGGIGRRVARMAAAGAGGDAGKAVPVEGAEAFRTQGLLARSRHRVSLLT